MTKDNQILISTLKNYLVKKRKDTKVALIIVLVICAGVLLLGVALPAGSDTGDIVAKSVIMTLAGAGAIAISWWAKKDFEKYDVDNCKLIEVIETNNKDNYIVWIYPQKTETKKYGATVATNYSLVFKTAEKSDYTIQIPSENDYSYITMLRMIISDITYGYSDEKMAQYKADPKSMIINK